MKEENVNEWLRLSESGQVAEAEDFYYDTLFRDVIEEFCERNSQPEIRCNVLFSILGYSPEPIILTQRALNPEVHVIFTTDINNEEASKKIREYLGTFLTSEFKIIEVRDTSFNGMYTSLKDQMLLHPSRDYVIDITGGKKSMVASAAIFGRDYNCNIVYVDYDHYLSQIRKPLPGSERLNYVYRPSLDLPEIKFFEDQKDIIAKNNPPSHNSYTEVSKPKVKNALPQVLSRTDFNDAFNHYVSENTTLVKNWLPSDVFLKCLSERSIILRSKETGDSITIQRAQLFDFFCKCQNNKKLASTYIEGNSHRARLLNPAIFNLLNAIKYDLYGDDFYLLEL